MNAEIVYYRAMVGMFNNIRVKSIKNENDNVANEIIAYYVYIYLEWGGGGGAGDSC